MALTAIDGRDPARFNFAGTGATAATDADPAHYEVSTGALATASLLAGEYTQLFGFVTPFGTAPPDFRADTFVDFSDRRAGLALGWGVNGTTAPFSASSRHRAHGGPRQRAAWRRQAGWPQHRRGDAAPLA